MAWTGTTTQFDSVVLALDTVKLCSTTLKGLSTMHSTDATGVSPGMIRLSTHTDVVQFPINSANGKMVIFGHLIAPDTSVGYVAVALRFPMSSDNLAWQQEKSRIIAGASTMDLGWKMFWSTNFASGTSASFAFVAGPFDNAKFGLNMGASSTTYIDKYQSYYECMFMMTTGNSTSATVPTFLNAASSSRAELFNVCAFELP
jgi:hypothetical protein